jgi:uncharacterized protein (DUF362 family)
MSLSEKGPGKKPERGPAIPKTCGIGHGQPRLLTRRDFLEAGLKTAAGLAVGASALSYAAPASRPVVGIARVRDDNIPRAVEEAVDLLGGIAEVTRGRERIMLKPNLVSPSRDATTKPEVVKTLAALMRSAGKDVVIGEGSAAAPPFNVRGQEVFRTSKPELLDGIQKSTFYILGYTAMAKSLGVPLVNLHTGDMVEVDVPGGFAFKKLSLHRSLTEIDLLCSVPMMKTHQLAHVTLGMKNLIGLYPGTVYNAVRWDMHDHASKVEPSGTAVAIIDMVRANKLGLVVVDASTAMEGEGPSNGTLVKMGLIIAGTNPLATDMVAARCMGFEPHEVPTFQWANKAGMTPTRLDEIEVRGEAIERVARPFARPRVYAWKEIRDVWGNKEI